MKAEERWKWPKHRQDPNAEVTQWRELVHGTLGGLRSASGRSAMSSGTSVEFITGIEYSLTVEDGETASGSESVSRLGPEGV